MNKNISYPPDGLSILSEIEDHSYWFGHRNAVISSVVERHPPGGTIFDVGGGNGFVSRGLEAAGNKCVVIEPDITGCALARQRGVEAFNGTLEEYPKDLLPAVGMFDVLEHIEDDQRTLNQVHAKLRPGGLFYVAVPTYNFLWSNADTDAGHFRRYTIGSLSGALVRSGFSIEHSTYFFSALVPAVFAFRTLPSVFGRGRSGGTSQAASDHTLPDGLFGTIFARTLRSELRLVRENRRIPFGSSCLIVARSR